MGGLFSRSVDVSEIERLYEKQLQRQIVIAADAVSEREALKLATRKNLLLWEFFAATTIGSCIVFYSAKAQNKMILVPLIPMFMAIGFHADQTTQEYADTIRKTAEDVLKNDRLSGLNNLRLIGGPITLTELDERRKRWQCKDEVSLIKS
ncbi:hypothetical protein M3Y96_01075400 [Aphelenchoides besseyi]|nr:hypothetical protein M3Y96_01075400 [Aphelenchoides besseyi]